VSDFGYSTLAADESLIYMPRTKPWNAPEWHHRGFKMSNAIKMDVYSFGMLCLWFLFKETEGYPDQSDIDEAKLNDTLLALAQQLLMGTAGLNDKQQSNLSSFFNLTLVRDPNSRSKDFKQLLQLLDQDG
jgi:serine/threonine protein kinase